MKNILRAALTATALTLVPAAAMATLAPAALAASHPAAPAASATMTGTLGIAPGPLYLASGPGLTVVDATGSGAGWQVLATVTGGTVTAAITTVGCGTGSTCSLPRTAIGYTTTLTPGHAPEAIAQALPGTGMGTSTDHVTWTAAGNVVISLQVISGP
jgi:hypothetical protein